MIQKNYLFFILLICFTVKCYSWHILEKTKIFCECISEKENDLINLNERIRQQKEIVLESSKKLQSCIETAHSSIFPNVGPISLESYENTKQQISYLMVSRDKEFLEIFTDNILPRDLKEVNESAYGMMLYFSARYLLDCCFFIKLSHQYEQCAQQYIQQCEELESITNILS